MSPIILIIFSIGDGHGSWKLVPLSRSSSKMFFFLIIQIKTLVFYLSSNQTSSFVPRIIQSLAGDSQQFAAVFLEIKEITVGWCVRASGRERSPVVLRGIQSFACTGQNFAAYLQKVDESSVWRTVAARHPWAATILRILYGVLCRIDSQQFFSYVDELWHIL